jgi:hypothetical protein
VSLRLIWQFLRESVASEREPTLAVKSRLKSVDRVRVLLWGEEGLRMEGVCTDWQDSVVGPVDVDAALGTAGAAGDDGGDFEGGWGFGGGRDGGGE